MAKNSHIAATIVATINASGGYMQPGTSEEIYYDGKEAEF